MRGWLALWVLLPLSAFADDAVLADLLSRIQQDGVAEFRYEETRKMELADVPVRSSGYMLSSPNGSLVKLQLLPKRLIMAIAEGRMLYWDPELKERHAASFSQAGAAAQQINVFRSILQGHAEELKPSFDFSAKKHGKHWTLKVSPKPGIADEDAPAIEISGEENVQRRKILIRQADGESTEYLMEKTQEGRQLDYSIQRLMSEAAGE